MVLEKNLYFQFCSNFLSFSACLNLVRLSLPNYNPAPAQYHPYKRKQFGTSGAFILGHKKISLNNARAVITHHNSSRGQTINGSITHMDERVNSLPAPLLINMYMRESSWESVFQNHSLWGDFSHISLSSSSVTTQCGSINLWYGYNRESSPVSWFLIPNYMPRQRRVKFWRTIYSYLN